MDSLENGNQSREVTKGDVAISTCTSSILLGGEILEEMPVMHRKWVKLRTGYCSEMTGLSASAVVFCYYCQQWQNKGCEVQEVSTWIEDWDFQAGD